jgi:hypothetical protein
MNESKHFSAVDAFLFAGFIPLPWWLIWNTVAGWLVDGYDPMAQHASEIPADNGSADSLAKLGALGSGVGFCLFAIGLWVITARRFSLGALAWFIFGASMLSNAIWPMGTPMHGLYAVGIINLIAPAISLLELRALRDDRLAYVTTCLVSFAGVLYLWMNLTGHDPVAWRGLTQRVFSSINSLWPAVIASIWFRRARGPSQEATNN